MENFKPYCWLKKQTGQYSVLFDVTIPNGFINVGLQPPFDDLANATRIYKYNVQVDPAGRSQTIEDATGNHLQPPGIQKVQIMVMDVTNVGAPVQKAETVLNYQNADDNPN